MSVKQSGCPSVFHTIIKKCSSCPVTSISALFLTAIIFVACACNVPKSKLGLQSPLSLRGISEFFRFVSTAETMRTPRRTLPVPKSGVPMLFSHWTTIPTPVCCTVPEGVVTVTHVLPSRSLTVSKTPATEGTALCISPFVNYSLCTRLCRDRCSRYVPISSIYSASMSGIW